MNCSFCGRELDKPGAKCAECGAVSGRLLTSDINGASGGVRSKFVLWAVFISQIPLQIFFTLWGGGFLGGFLHLGSLLLRNYCPDLPISPISERSAMLFVGALFFVMVPLVICLRRLVLYKRRTWHFMSDRLELTSGASNVTEICLPYASIREISIRRGALQRILRLGSLVVTVSTPLGPRASGKNFLIIPDIENPQIVCELLKDRILACGLTSTPSDDGIIVR